MIDSQKIIVALVSAFFPDPVPASTRAKIVADNLHVDEILEQAGIKFLPELRGSLKNLRGEQRLRLFRDSLYLAKQGYWLQGMDKDILAEFPGQRLIQVRNDTRELVNWSKHWVACGGKLFNGDMVALKWDSVWSKISAFGLPFPPFQLGSGYDVEDVDRDEAEDLGFKMPKHFKFDLSIAFDIEDLTRRFTLSLQKLESSEQCKE